MWARIIGIDPAATGDKEFYRALEWGALEVPTSNGTFTV
jgi:hypothetical protein